MAYRMRRFQSIEYAPAETRRILRERLRRYLWTHGTKPLNASKPGKLVVSDEAALAILQSLQIQFASDAGSASEAYQTRAESTGDPNWAELDERGLVRTFFGRVLVPF